MGGEMSKSPETTAREHRLAAKLRENLRRRKDQARARSVQDATVVADDSPVGQAPLKPATDSDSTS